MAENGHSLLSGTYIAIFLRMSSEKIGIFMKIGVLSDTHLLDIDSCRRLAERLMSGAFRDVDAILHAGDVVTAELENCFSPVPWYSVRGNMDHSLSDVPVSRILRFGQKKIGLIHGWGGHADLEDRVMAYFSGDALDALVYGHSHQPCCHLADNILVMNPGSATDRRSAPHHTVGMLTLGEQISGEIIIIG
ncbi:MAG TPA: YfcE family phosphodiesterase [Malonomonas sp.]